MSLLQAYQAELLADLDEGEGVGPNAVCKLRRATDFSLRATKETAKSIGRSMAALVVTERHLWLNLRDITTQDKDFMDAPISPPGLFCDAVISVIERFQELAKQAAAFQKLLPRSTQISGAAEWKQPQTSKASSSYRATQKQSIACHAPPPKVWGHGKHTQPQPTRGKTDLRTVIIAKNAGGKRSWRPRAKAIEDPPPQEVEWSTPDSTVPVFLLCPQGTVLPTLPPCVLQGIAVSGERISQGPPGNIVALGCPPPLRRVLEWLVQTLPIGLPFQDVVLTAQLHINPETSLERLVPLAEFLTAWKLLPNISRWVLQNIEKGYQIQFGSRPPRFMGVLSTEVLVMEQEVKALLEKGAIECVPRSNRESGFNRRFFIVSKKDGGCVQF